MAAEDYLPFGGLFPDDDDTGDYEESLMSRRRFVGWIRPVMRHNGSRPLIANAYVPRRAKMLTHKLMNKFYVGAEHIARGIAAGVNDKWTRKTEAEAIEHAKKLLADDPSKDCVIIVKITHVVRRREQPIVVERVK